MPPKKRPAKSAASSKSKQIFTNKSANANAEKKKKPTAGINDNRISAISKALEKLNPLRKKAPPPKIEKSKSKQTVYKNIVVSKVHRQQGNQVQAGAVKHKEAEVFGDLPFSYNETKLVFLARDPFWAYTYWDFSGETWNWIQGLRHKKNGLRYVLRIRNIDDQRFFDIDVQLETKNWYVHIGIPDASFEAELGMIDSNGQYYLIVKSNRIRMPRNGPSSEIDAKWHPDFFDEIYQLSGGGQRGRSSDISSQFRRRSS
ncbi:MAG: hypothetical protein A3K09_04760 [Nitrospinae bacterium RIFCSPLOWO2_12_FULL_47_7]|nr:MAG: hypothetical protein A3K09_04760 [Nitrospinae bacterium RIFCSPLOWO2_12_FULL_47_7]